MTRVRLVGGDGLVTGSEEKLVAHLAPGLRHEAFSVFVRDSAGRLLVQRRAAGKYHFAGVWANACCSHPFGDAPLIEQARIRLEEEMGLDLPLFEIGVFEYRAEDPVSGLVEWEYDHVLVGRCDDDPSPDPAEVDAWEWVTAVELTARIGTADPTLAPWLVTALSAFPQLLS